MFQTVRVWFSKTGAAKYISHLDLTRCMARALKLSGLPVWYTQGFNPRIYMTFAMPLSLGVSGERECMEIRLVEETDFALAAAGLNRCLPKDIRVLNIAEPQHPFDAIAFAEYELYLSWDEPQALSAAMDRLMSKDSVIVMKHSKKGDKPFDIKPAFEAMTKEILPEAAVFTAALPCTLEGSVNPSLLLRALKQYEGIEPDSEITRKRLLAKDFSDIQ